VKKKEDGRRKNSATRARQVEEDLVLRTMLLDTSPDSFFLHDADGKLLYVNELACTARGYTREELLKINLRELDAPEYAALVALRVAVLRKKGVASFESGHLRKDGTVMPVEVRTRLVRVGDRELILSSARDITDRKRDEAVLADLARRLAVIVAQMPVVVWTTDTELRFTSLVGAGLKQMGLTPGQLVGQTVFDYFRTKDAGHPAIAAHRRALADEHASYVLETNGIFYDSDVQPLHDVLGDVVGSIGVARDITAQKQAEDAREKLIAELDAFSYTVAHDLKGPVGTVIGFAEFLKAGGRAISDKDVRESLDALYHSGHRMKTIIDEILLLAGVLRTEVETAPLDMSVCVRGALQELDHMTQEYHPELNVPDSWPTALGHAGWIEEVWANYLANGMKYGGKPPKLELGAETTGDRVRFWVRDHGPGLTPEQRSRLFVPFTQLHQVRSSGQGLGLSIVQRIMDKLGGEAWVESEPGEGSKFGFTLPRAPAPTSAPTQPKV